MYIPNSDPTKLVINENLTPVQLEALKVSLTYTDQAANFAFQKFKRNGHWYLARAGEDAYQQRLQDMKAETKVCLLEADEDGSYWTRSGLASYISKKLNSPVKNSVEYPAFKPLPWDKKPPYEMYPYQETIVERLLEAKHAGVSAATGLGKSFCITNIIKRMGLKTLVMAPSSSIAEQLHKSLEEAFGKKYVGPYFGGKKDFKKLIVVGTAQSFTRIEEDTPAWKALSQTDVFIADESHQCPASTLASVCFGLVKKAPYRFFFSATQMRNDGAGLLLDAITGPIVFEMTVRQGVEGGFLARPEFCMFRIDGNGDFKSDDPNEMTRHHLYYHPKVSKMTGELCNQAAARGIPTLVLIDEVEQFTKLLPHLKYQVGFAHGTLNENKGKVPKEYWDSDPNALVADFNAGKIPILVGTSCISTGTDIKPAKLLIYLMGGKSEIKVKQAIGRGTRIAPGKTSCKVVDFWVDAPTVSRHAQLRSEIYEELCGPVIIKEV